MKKYLPILLIASGCYAIYRQRHAAAAHVNGMGDLGFGFKKFVKKTTRAVGNSVATPLKIAVAAPLKVAIAPGVAIAAAIQHKSLRAGVQSFAKSANAPQIALTKAAQPLLTKHLQNMMIKTESGTAARVLFGRARPVVNRTGAPTTPADPGVVWNSIAARPGWSTANGEGGTVVFKGPSGQTFSATPADLNQLGGATGVIDYYMGVAPAPQASVQPSTGPQQYAQPGQTPGIIDPSQVPSSSGQSFTDPSLDPSQQYSPLPAAASPSIVSDPATIAPAATDPTAQQFVPAQPDPAPAKKVNPLVAIGTLLAVPALFMLTGKK